MRASHILLIVVVVLTLSVGVMALSAPRWPVLLSVSSDPTMLRPRNYCLMNPFRDRGPERAAERYLAEMRDGHVVVIEPFLDGENRERVMSNEAKWPIRSWRVGRRKHTRQGCDLMYWVRRGNGYDAEEEVYFAVQGLGDRARVVRYGAIY